MTYLEEAAGQRGTITHDQLEELGLGDEAIWRLTKKCLLFPVFPGVYATSPAPYPPEVRLFAACCWAGDGVASHKSAAREWGVDGFTKYEGIQITAQKRRRVKTPGFQVFRWALPAHLITTRNGLPITKPTRMLSDLAMLLSEKKLVRAVDAAERQGLVSEEALRRYVAAEAGKGKRGIGILRRLLAVRDPAAGPSASAFQKDVRELLGRLKERGLDVEWREEAIIVDEDGEEVARVDLFDDPDSVIVEADGRQTHSSRDDWVHDLRRRRRITAQRHLVLHVTPDDLATEEGREAFLDDVERTIRRQRAAQRAAGGSAS